MLQGVAAMHETLVSKKKNRAEEFFVTFTTKKLQESWQDLERGGSNFARAIRFLLLGVFGFCKWEEKKKRNANFTGTGKIIQYIFINSAFVLTPILRVRFFF